MTARVRITGRTSKQRAGVAILCLAGFAFVAGCSVVSADLVSGIDEYPAEVGYLAFRFDSNWKYPNESPWGRQLAFGISTDGQSGKTIGFTTPDTLKIAELKPATYHWRIGMIDQNAFPTEAITFTVEEGKVTNLGNVFVEIPYDAKGRYDFKIATLRQSDFLAVEEAVTAKSKADLRFDRQRIVPNRATTRMRNSRGAQFDVQVELTN